MKTNGHRWSRHYRVDPIEAVSYKKMGREKKIETLQLNWQMHFVGLKEIQLKIDMVVPNLIPDKQV